MGSFGANFGLNFASGEAGIPDPTKLVTTNLCVNTKTKADLCVTNSISEDLCA